MTSDGARENTRGTRSLQGILLEMVILGRIFIRNMHILNIFSTPFDTQTQKCFRARAKSTSTTKAPQRSRCATRACVPRTRLHPRACRIEPTREGGLRRGFAPSFRTRILKRPGDPPTRFRRGFPLTVKNVDPPNICTKKSPVSV